MAEPNRPEHDDDPGFFRWRLHGNGRTVAPGGIVRPKERLIWPVTIGLGAQHVVAMFGATFLVPLLTGFPPTTTLLFSGIGTMLFLLITRNRVPSYLGSSFAFIAPITAASASSMNAALGGVLITGALLAIVGLIVTRTGTGWIDALMPPVVMGAIVALIGFNLAPAARDNFFVSPLTGLVTLAAVVLCMVLFRGLLGRVSILLGVVVGYLFALVRNEIDFTPVQDASWFGLPPFHTPSFEWGLIPMFLPVVFVLIAENVGHVKSVAQMTGEDMNPYMGRALFADGAATVLSAIGGGSPTTTYGENIGVMAATRVYSSAAYWVAGLVAVGLSLSPKFGALLNTVPAGVLGGVTVALYGLIGIIGVRMWVENKVDFARPKNQMTAGIALIVGIANFTVTFGSITLTGIALGSIAAIVVYHLMNQIGDLTGAEPKEEPTPTEAGPVGPLS
ncbi:uracil-xanthine permease family protein [Enemella sp. A6]|uniref:uracil-xanthine permease family protein n=1 Tax=Enemella sp. A6 TaxID=3440152 RepID=UPI003EB8AE88